MLDQSLTFIHFRLKNGKSGDESVRKVGHTLFQFLAGKFEILLDIFSQFVLSFLKGFALVENVVHGRFQISQDGLLHQVQSCRDGRQRFVDGSHLQLTDSAAGYSGFLQVLHGRFQVFDANQNG